MALAITASAYTIDKAFRSDTFKDYLGVAIPQYGTYRQGQQALEAQQRAEEEAKRQAREQAARAERDFNRLNQKKPDLAALFSANAGAASAGAGSTMLTGPSGVDMSTTKLGKTSLLGA